MKSYDFRCRNYDRQSFMMTKYGLVPGFIRYNNIDLDEVVTNESVITLEWGIDLDCFNMEERDKLKPVLRSNGGFTVGDIYREINNAMWWYIDILYDGHDSNVNDTFTGFEYDPNTHTVRVCRDT